MIKKCKNQSMFKKRIKQISVSMIEKQVRLVQPALPISANGLHNIINSEVFWTQFVKFMIQFITDNPTIQDKRRRQENLDKKKEGC